MNATDVIAGPKVRIIQGSALEVLKGMEAGAVQCCITSPPYFRTQGLRHGQLAGRR